MKKCIIIIASAVFVLVAACGALLFVVNREIDNISFDSLDN